jgi:hypothetical protein
MSGSWPGSRRSGATSAQLVVSPEEQCGLLPEKRAQEAMGITGFTLPTMLRWVRSDAGRAMTLHPFQRAGRHRPEGGGLGRRQQYRAIKCYLDARGLTGV